MLAAVRRLETLSGSEERVWGRLFSVVVGVAAVVYHPTPRLWRASCCPRAVIYAVPGHPCWLMKPRLLTRVSPLPRVLMVTGRGDTGMHRLSRRTGQATSAPCLPRPSLGPTRRSTPSLPVGLPGERRYRVYLLQAASTSAGPPILYGRLRPMAGRARASRVETGHARGHEPASTGNRRAVWRAMSAQPARSSPLTPPGFLRDTMGSMERERWAYGFPTVVLH